MPEVWREIPGTHGFYEASSEGRIRSIDRVIRKLSCRGRTVLHRTKGRILKAWPDGSGYLAIYVCFAGERVARNVHRLVALAFLGEPPFDPADVNHDDGDKQNNRPSNLEWCTRIDNMAHARNAGLLKPIRGYVGTPISGGAEVYFASEVEAAAAVGAAKRGNISSAANSKLRQAHGYFWRHAA